MCTLLLPNDSAGVRMDSYSLSALGQNSLSCIESGGSGGDNEGASFQRKHVFGETRSGGVILTSALEGKYVKGEKLENIFGQEEK